MHHASQPDNVSVFPALYAVPRWTLIPAALAPISLVGAWAGLAQPGEYDAIRQTISVRAGYAAADRWIMTLGLSAVVICQLVVAIGLSAARPLARVLLVMGGLAGLGVAIFPQPMHGSGAAHMVFATLSVTFVALWPATLGSRAGSTPWSLGSGQRVDAAVANSWPLVVILVLCHSYSVAEPES